MPARRGALLLGRSRIATRRPAETRWDLGYLGTYSADRQPALDDLMCERRPPTRRTSFSRSPGPLSSRLVVARQCRAHRACRARRHGWFYSRQRFTLNVTRADMLRWAIRRACGCSRPLRVVSRSSPIGGRVSTQSLSPGSTSWSHIVGRRCSPISAIFPNANGGSSRSEAREHVLAHHTAAHRAVALEGYVEELLGRVSRAGPPRGIAYRGRDETRDFRPRGQFLLGERPRRLVARR